MNGNVLFGVVIICCVIAFIFRAPLYWFARRWSFMLRLVIFHDHTFERARIKWSVEALRLTTLQTYPNLRMRRIITPGDGRQPSVAEHESDAPLPPGRLGRFGDE